MEGTANLLQQQMTDLPSAKIPHGETDYRNDLRLYENSAGPYHLSDLELRALQYTANENKPSTSWSTYARFTFTLQNPLANHYLQRGISGAIVAFAHLSDLLPIWAVPVVTAVPALFEGITLFTKFHNRDGHKNLHGHFAQWLTIPFLLLTGFVFYSSGKANPERDAAHLGHVFTLPAFLSLFVTNCYCTYVYGKPEHDFRLQLTNLQQLLQEHPEIEEAIEKLRHLDPEAHDNAFVDSNNNLIISPFYHVIREEGATPVRHYLQIDELLTMTKDADLSKQEIYCDRARFEEVLKTFKEALAQSEPAEENIDHAADLSIIDAADPSPGNDGPV